MGDLTLRQLEHYVAVAETGSVTVGASKAHVTQSAMSASLSELEKSLGTALLQRHRRGITLTPAGHALLAKVRRLLEEVNELHATAREIDSSLRGPLTVGCYSTIAPSLMPKAIQTFLTHHPEVDLRFIEGSDEDLLESLLQGRCEIVVTYDYRLERFSARQTLALEQLSAAPPRAVLPEGHSLAQHDIGLADLANEPLIMLDLAPAGEYFRGMFESCGLEPRIRFTTKSHQLVLSLVAQGLGCALLTQVGSPMGSAPPPGLTVQRLTDELPPLPIVALSPQGIQRTRRTEAFIEHSRMALRD